RQPGPRLANDRQRLRVLQAHENRRRRKAYHRQARLLDGRHARGCALGVIRKTAAVWAGKATGALSRVTKRGGGTTLPGDVARAIDPKILTRLAHDLTPSRDELDRYGELESIAKKIEHALSAQPETGRAILNADDPRVAEIGLSLPTPPLWFGLDDTSIASKTLPHAADARTCPKC